MNRPMPRYTYPPHQFVSKRARAMAWAIIAIVSVAVFYALQFFG